MSIDTFLKLEGIEGESKDHKFSDAINIVGWEWGANWPLAPGGMNISSGQIRVNHMIIHKCLDKSSPILLSYMSNNEEITEGEIINRKAGGPDILEFYTIKLSHVRILGVSRSASQGATTMTETVTLGFHRYAETYEQQDSKGVGKGAVEAALDMSPAA